MRASKPIGLGTDTSCGTSVEYQNGVPSPAEALPPGQKSSEDLPLPKVASPRRRSHLVHGHRGVVAGHLKVEKAKRLLFLSQLLLLLAPKAHLFENEGFRLLVLTEPLGHAGHIDGS